MKKQLIEEIERIHQLTYSKENIQEQSSFLDNLKSKVNSVIKKIDDPKKADLVSPDVRDFFNTLQIAAEKGGLSQQQKGSMTYQKEVESMQIGLELLGYDLPKYGVDGLFGPETAAAVSKFTRENVDDHINEDASILRNTLNQLGYDEKGGELTSGGNLSKEISTIVSSILNEFKKIKPDVQVIVTSGNDSFHKKIGYKSKHSEGNAVDLVLKPYNSDNANSFLTILNKYKSKDSKFTFIDEYKNPSGAATGGHFHLQYGGGGVTNVNNITATSQMLNKLIELLKEKGVKPEELKQYIDKSINVSGVTDSNYYVRLLETLGAQPSEENLKFLYAWRQAEGKSGKYNPFNTTQPMPGATNFNSVGVKNYQSLEDGFVATIKTLRNGKYNCIINGLVNDIGASRIAQCESLKTWGTGDLLAKVVSSYNSGAQPKVSSLA